MSEEIPTRYARLVQKIAAAEVVLGSGSSDLASTISVHAADELAYEALEAWIQTKNEATNQLRARANIIHGLTCAYAGRPWRETIPAASICVDIYTPEPVSTAPETLRLYALGSANSVVLRLIENSKDLRYAAWEQTCIALDFFSQISPEGIYHWKGVCHLASALLGERDNRANPNQIAEDIRLALTNLDIESDLYQLARYLQGRGNGRIPHSGWFGTRLFARRAKFTTGDLYHFAPFPS